MEIHIDKEGKISSSHGDLKVGITKQQYQEGLLNWIMVPENNEKTFVEVRYSPSFRKM